MSEYQYYEFQVLEKPLTEKEMRELRAVSTRARITATSFINEYDWGDFKGNPDRWMEKYFDAFLYYANWGTHVLKLRLPARLLDLKTTRLYCAGESASARVKDGGLILSFDSDDEGGDWEGDEGSLSDYVSMRTELLRGDLRALYLGWLLCAQNGELDEDAPEPPVPSGLKELSASLTNLVDFLRIDSDLLTVAAQASAPLKDATPAREEVSAWVSALPPKEKDKLLVRLMTEEENMLGSELRKRFFEEHSTGAGGEREPSTSRSVGELLRTAEAHAAERKRLAAKKAAEKMARREREEAIHREKYLDSLAGREAKLWGDVEALIGTKQPLKYDLAIQRLCDLRDLARRQGDDNAFRTCLNALRAAHARKPSLLERLKKAGL